MGIEISIIECSQPKVIKSKMRGLKLTSGIYGKRIKAKRHKTKAVCLALLYIRVGSDLPSLSDMLDTW
jgi:hypothetical protein